jgi:hypothetical protein
LLRRQVCVARTVGLWVRGWKDRSGTWMAPDPITVRGHRRPRLYRAATVHGNIIVR